MVECSVESIMQRLQKLIYINQIYSGITCGRVLNGELYTWKLYKIDLSVFVDRLLHEERFLSNRWNKFKLERNVHETVGKQIQINYLLSHNMTTFPLLSLPVHIYNWNTAHPCFNSASNLGRLHIQVPVYSSWDKPAWPWSVVLWNITRCPLNSRESGWNTV